MLVSELDVVHDDERVLGDPQVYHVMQFFVRTTDRRGVMHEESHSQGGTDAAEPLGKRSPEVAEELVQGNVVARLTTPDGNDVFRRAHPVKHVEESALGVVLVELPLGARLDASRRQGCPET